MSKRILVTGGSRGIGAATVRLLAQRGDRVCVNYRRDASAAAALVDELDGRGAEVFTAQADVADEAEVMALFESLDARWGGLDGLVNNAGILHTKTRLSGIDAARINAVLATNVTGTLLCAREAVNRMSTASGGAGGSIVNVSSSASRLGAPNEYIDYAASKGAVDALTTGLAVEVATEGVRVNAVRPGLIYTDIHASGGEPGRVDRLKHVVPMQRGGLAEEVAEAIVWLLSDASSYTTGSFIDVSGGR
ncbi:MAG: SDR family oxidoreductase [Pseudomonadota bacterium]